MTARALALGWVLSALFLLPASPLRAGDEGEAVDPISRAFLLPLRDYFVEPDDVGLEARDVEFRNRAGKKLTGWHFDTPDTERAVLICGGNAGNVSQALHYARIFSGAGFDVLLFNYQGYGTSDGPASVMSLVGDALAAYDHLTGELGAKEASTCVFGVSLGSVLAIALGAQRSPAAVAVEDVFLPSDHLAAFKESIGDDRMGKLVILGIERLVLPAVDPLSTATELDCPLFLVHGEDDWLLPPSGTVRVAAAARAADVTTRVWLLDDVGHAPESLEWNDREYAAQLTGFFDAALTDGLDAAPRVRLAETRETEDGFEARVDVTASGDERVPVEIAFADAEGEASFARIWAAPGESSHVEELPFEPVHVSAVAYHHVSPDAEDSWREDLTKLSSSRRAFRRFEAAFGELPVRRFKPVGVPGYGEVFVRTYDDVHVEQVTELLPATEDVHPHIRPRYARLLAQLQMGQAKIAADDDLPVAARVLELLPENGDQYFELGSGSFVLGFRDPLVAESLWLLALRRAHAGDRDGAREALAAYIDTVPPRATPRVTKEQLDELDELEGLPPLGGE